MEKIHNGKAVVMEGHTLGVIIDGEFPTLDILRASVLRGSPYNSLSGPVPLVAGSFRYATEKDFIDFKVISHPDWFFN